jgi:4'-phosphopantetheinyl transferase EntD
MTADQSSDPAIDPTLRSIAPPDVDVGSRVIDDADLRLLLPAERAAIARAVPVRQREFATGRVLLRSLIGTTSAILVGHDRAPVLPVGVAGSLAHDRRCAIAAVTRRPGIVLGIDIEPVDALPPSTAAMVLRPDEDVDAHLAFTLKEAAYKAWSRAGGGMLGHHDVRVALDGRAFVASVVGTDVTISGAYGRAGDRWVALAIAGASPAPSPHR